MAPVFTITAILILAALVITLAAGMGKAPLWVAVLLVVIVEMFHIWPR